MPNKHSLAPAALAAAVAVGASGCYRVSHYILDDDNPDTVFMSSTEQGGVATHFHETAIVYTSLFGLIAWNSPDPRTVLAPYYYTGKVQNLTVRQGQSFVEGLVTLLTAYGFLVGMRHVTYEGEVVRRIGG